MFLKIKNWLHQFRLSLRHKIILSLSAIAVVLLMSSVISILEYRRMSSYVSNLIAGNVQNIHLTQELIDAVDTYNLQILTVVGDDNLNSVPDFDRAEFVSHCDSLREAIGKGRVVPLADSVIYAYSAYMLASLELEDVLESDFINTRDWYLERLQPLFGRMRGYLNGLSATMYEELQENSKDFDRGFFRSIIPSAVAIAVGILLVFLLMFYLLSFFVNPVYGMLASLRDYLSFRRRYTYGFDGNDQLSELNGAVTDLTEENRQLRRRVADLKEQKSPGQ